MHDIKFLCNGKYGKALSFYITDYITKKALTTTNAFPLIIAATKEIEQNIHPCRPNPLFTKAKQQNRDLLVKCLNKLTTFSERSGPEVATLLLGKPLLCKSHQFSKAFITTFVNELSTKKTKSTDSDTDDDERHPEDSNKETFSIRSTEDTDKLALVNQRVHYTLRSKLLKVSLYDFTAQFYVGPKDKTKQAKIRACSNKNIFEFDVAHPQYESHHLIKYNNPYSYHIPVIVGPQFPNKEQNPERYYMLFLILFKPFFDVNELKSHDTWETSFSHCTTIGGPKNYQMMKEHI